MVEITDGLMIVDAEKKIYFFHAERPGRICDARRKQSDGRDPSRYA